MASTIEISGVATSKESVLFEYTMRDIKMINKQEQPLRS